MRGNKDLFVGFVQKFSDKTVRMIKCTAFVVYPVYEIL